MSTNRGSNGFVTFDPSVAAVASAWLKETGAGGGGQITGAGTYYSVPSPMVNALYLGEIMNFAGTLAGTLTLEVSDGTEDTDRLGTTKWVADDTFSLPAIACGLTNRVTDTDALVFQRGTGSDLTARVATTTYLPACTAAGSGVGKTLTMNAVGILTVDGAALVLNDKVLVKDQVNKVDNGFYKVTTAGTVSVAAILTRDTAMDATAECVPGTAVAVTAGTINATTSWILNGTDQTIAVRSTRPITHSRVRLAFARSSGQGSIESVRALKG